MSNIVITGSTKGIGRGLAVAFVERGHNVTVCSRGQEDVDAAVAALNALGPGKSSGVTCDVSRKSDLQALWDHAVQAFGPIDIWINNAGTANTRFETHELPEQTTETLISSNILGTTFASQVAINGLRAQGSGALYNMLGGSFEGRFLVPNMSVYSATKSAIFTLTRYLIKENKDQDIIIGMINPGTLITENWLSEQQELSAEEWAKFKPIMNILCDHVEDVAPVLVERILANTKSGARIRWMNNWKMTGRFFNAYVLRRKRDLFSRYGL